MAAPMKAQLHLRKEQATTLGEVLLVVVLIALVACILLPMFYAPRTPARRISCVSNLKNVGVAFRLFAADNGERWPWQIAGTNGTMDFLADPTPALHFQFLSNELSSTKFLLCPIDGERTRAPSFFNLGHSNLSYFLNLDADSGHPKTVSSGDRNLTTNGFEVGPGLLPLGHHVSAGFSQKMHNERGNILLGDGSVQEVTSRRLRDSFAQAAVASTNTVNRLLIP